MSAENNSRAVDDCAICCEAMQVPERIWVGQPPCKHVFHSECIKQWIDARTAKFENSLCPLCREPIRTFNGAPAAQFTNEEEFPGDYLPLWNDFMEDESWYPTNIELNDSPIDDSNVWNEVEANNAGIRNRAQAREQVEELINEVRHLPSGGLVGNSCTPGGIPLWQELLQRFRIQLYCTNELQPVRRFIEWRRWQIETAFILDVAPEYNNEPSGIEMLPWRLRRSQAQAYLLAERAFSHELEYHQRAVLYLLQTFRREFFYTNDFYNILDWMDMFCERDDTWRVLPELPLFRCDENAPNFNYTDAAERKAVVDAQPVGDELEFLLDDKEVLEALIPALTPLLSAPPPVRSGGIRRTDAEVHEQIVHVFFSELRVPWNWQDLFVTRTERKAILRRGYADEVRRAKELVDLLYVHVRYSDDLDALLAMLRPF